MLKRLIISSITVLFLISWLLGCGGGDGTSTPPAPATLSAVSSFGTVTKYTPGVSFPVTLVVTPLTSTHIYTVTEQAPDGWTITMPSDQENIVSSSTSNVVWQFVDNKQRTLTYTVTPPTTATGEQTFAGNVLFNGTPPVYITGARTIDLDTTAPIPPTAIPSFSMAQYTPGTGFIVSIKVIPASTTAMYAVEDTIPTNWIASAINEGGAWDQANHKVKWGPFNDATLRTLTYQIRPPADATGSATFTCIASFDGRDISFPRTICPK